ncbi:hypothetical protein, partial [Candidatus Phycosocius spiralis]|uniref:hypothetical protein n=1 Tax=Candidatus Phycosocius spiralis TaxID=2815099 RepID=UPI0024E049CC
MISLRKQFANSVALAAIGTGLLLAGPATALVTPNKVQPTSVIDVNNTRPYWVLLGMRNSAGGMGSCSGLLINPRTVLFAAHCVGFATPDAYDPTKPTNNASVGYTTDPMFGRANLANWITSGRFPGFGDGRTMVNSTMVWWDQRSRGDTEGPGGPLLDPKNGAFLPADIAIAGFDTPTELLGRDAQNGIGLLFSRVNGPVAV